MLSTTLRELGYQISRITTVLCEDGRKLAKSIERLSEEFKKKIKAFDLGCNDFRRDIAKNKSSINNSCDLLKRIHKRLHENHPNETRAIRLIHEVVDVLFTIIHILNCINANRTHFDIEYKKNIKIYFPKLFMEVKTGKTL